jgi:cyclopropane fatty-acyl-phospholipid synthase-like methyltransferase
VASATFDAAKYRQTTREQWQAAAEAWSRWSPTLEQWLGEATQLMLDLARVDHGGRVLDIAPGAGGPSRATLECRAGTGSSALQIGGH